MVCSVVFAVGVFLMLLMVLFSTHLYLCRNQQRSANSSGSVAPGKSRRRCSAILSRRPFRLLWPVKMSVKSKWKGHIWKEYHVWKGSLCFTLSAVCVNQVQPTTQCTFCILLIKTLEDFLPKERTEVSYTHAVKEHTCIWRNTKSLCPAHPHTHVDT